MDTVSEDVLSELSLAGASVVYYVAGFIVKSLRRSTNCPNCLNTLGNGSEENLMVILLSILYFKLVGYK